MSDGRVGTPASSIRLIALDVDGTSLNRAGVCTPRTRRVLQQLIDRGYLVVPATGRAAPGVVGQTLPLKGVAYVISSDGAMITRCGDGVCIDKRLIPWQAAADLAGELESDTTCVYYQRDDRDCTHVMACSSREVYRVLKKYSDYEDDLWHTVLPNGLDRQIRAEGKDVVKMGLWFPREKGFEAYERMLRQQYPPISCFRADDNVLEFTAKGVSKATALAALAEHLGIPMEQTLAIGDNGNDVEMIRAAGIGVAMGNAIPAAKAAADYIAGTQDQDGAACFLESFLLGIGTP